MRRPFIGVLMAYTVGVLMGEWFESPLGWLLAGAWLILIGFWAIPSGRPLLLASLLVACGWTQHTRQRCVLAPHDLRNLIGDVAEMAEVRGRLARRPELKATQSGAGLQWRTRALIEVTATRLRGRWQPARGRVLASMSGILGKDYFAGKAVEVSGVLRPPDPALAPRLFDYRDYLARRGIYYVLVTDGRDDWSGLDAGGRSGPGWSDRFLDWAEVTLARGLPLDDEAVRLRWAMLLGWRGAMTEELAEPFMRSGTMHVFAISGLHVMMIASILVGGLRLLRLSRAHSGLLVLPLLWVYAGATGWQPSAVRATVMMTVVIGGWAMRRPSDLLNSLAGAAFIILVWDPRQLFHVGFQLSFGVVLSLAVWLPVGLSLRDRWLAADPFLPEPLRSPPKEWWREKAREFGGAAAVSASAWIGSLSLSAWYFHLVTPVSLLANLVMVPLAGLVVLSGLCSFLCGAGWSWATECFNHSGWLVMKGMVLVSQWGSTLPGACWPVGRPSLLFMAGYAGLLLLPLTPRTRGARFGVAFGSAVVIALGVMIPVWRDREAAEITVLPVGGGDSLWVDLPGNENDLLIDTGDERAVEWITVPFLRAQGRTGLANLLLTHGDARHVAGVAALLEACTVDRVWVGPAKARSTVYRRGVEALRGAGQNLVTVSRGDRQGPLRVLHPVAADKFTTADDQTVVMLLEWYGARILLCSDLGRLGQSVLAERELDLTVDVVVAGMPTGVEPLSDALLDQLRPQWLILSTGRYPADQQATRALRVRLGRRGIPVHYTEDEGAVTVRADPGGWEVRTRESAGW